MTDRFNALSLSHRFLAEHVRPGDLCIDATAGRGYDTAYLAGLTGETGRVLAFDIQQEAVDSTNALLRKRGLDRIAQVHLDSHVNMERYAQPAFPDRAHSQLHAQKIARTCADQRRHTSPIQGTTAVSQK